MVEYPLLLISCLILWASSCWCWFVAGCWCCSALGCGCCSAPGYYCWWLVRCYPWRCWLLCYCCCWLLRCCCCWGWSLRCCCLRCLSQWSQSLAAALSLSTAVAGPFGSTRPHRSFVRLWLPSCTPNTYRRSRVACFMRVRVVLMIWVVLSLIRILCLWRWRCGSPFIWGCFSENADPCGLSDRYSRLSSVSATQSQRRSHQLDFYWDGGIPVVFWFLQDDFSSSRPQIL